MNFNKGMLDYVWSCQNWDLQYGQNKRTTPSLTIKKYWISFTFASFKKTILINKHDPLPAHVTRRNAEPEEINITYASECWWN